MSAAILSVRGLSKRFGALAALDNVTLDVAPGEKLGIIGPNGSGKTTLINCVTGILRPDRGAVALDGQDVSNLPAYRRARLGLTRSFQIPRPFVGISVIDNVRVPLDYAKTPDHDGARARELLALVGLSARADHHAEELTHLELRKLELARALAAEPRLLIADEVMAGLTESEIDEVLETLFALNERGVTVIMIEHIMHAIMCFSRRLICMETGRIIADATPHEVSNDPEVRRSILANRLVVDRLCAGYGAVSVLRSLSLEVREGELVALLGTNGNGKSTLLNAIMGLISSTSGSVRLEWDGETQELRGRRADGIVALGVTLVPEGRRLFPHLTVEENLRLGGSGRRARARLKKNLDFAFSTFGLLAERRSQRAGTMSGGQQQVLAIARALMCEPRLMLIDEPSVGLAPVAVNQVFASIKSLQRERGIAVLMSEQSIGQAIAIADRSYLITHGQISRELDREHANASADAISATLLGGVD